MKKYFLLGLLNFVSTYSAEPGYFDSSKAITIGLSSGINLVFEQVKELTWATCTHNALFNAARLEAKLGYDQPNGYEPNFAGSYLLLRLKNALDPLYCTFDYQIEPLSKFLKIKNLLPLSIDSGKVYKDRGYLNDQLSGFLRKFASDKPVPTESISEASKLLSEKMILDVENNKPFIMNFICSVSFAERDNHSILISFIVDKNERTMIINDNLNMSFYPELQTYIKWIEDTFNEIAIKLQELKQRNISG